MSRVSEPLFYTPGYDYYEFHPIETFEPQHRAEWLVNAQGSTPNGRGSGVLLYDRTPPNYKPRHRNTPSWEATSISDALRNFIGGA